MPVYELLGTGSARSRLDLSRERGLSRFVGRAEDKMLEEALERQVGTRRGDRDRRRSRCGQEPPLPRVRGALRAQGIDVYEAQAQAHGSDPVPAGAADDARLLRDRGSGFRAGGEEKIAGRLLLLDPDFADDLPLVFDFLGVPDPNRPRPR